MASCQLEIRIGRVYRRRMLLLRRLLVALTIIPFVGGMTLQATPSAAALGLVGSSHVDTGCPNMAAHLPAEQQPMPTRGTGADCMKQMGCLGTPSLPARSGEATVPFTYSRVTYSLPSTTRVGGSVEPELLPPIGL